MKRILVLVFFIIGISCDPYESLEATITNTTLKELSVTFISVEIPEFNETISIDAKGSILYADFGSIGGVGLSFIDFDSIYIQDTSNKILKVFKQDTSGKNIYNVNEYWMVEEISKDHFVYTYEITEEDLK